MPAARGALLRVGTMTSMISGLLRPCVSPSPLVPPEGSCRGASGRQPSADQEVVVHDTAGDDEDLPVGLQGHSPRPVRAEENAPVQTEPGVGSPGGLVAEQCALPPGV